MTPRRFLVAACAVGLAARLAAIEVAGASAPPLPGSDEQEFDTYAWSLAQGRGYRGMSPDVSDKDHRTAYRPPVPSIVFAVIYRIAGHRYDAVRRSIAVVDLGTLIVLYWLVRRVARDGIARLFATLYAVYPFALFETTQITAETIFTCLLALFVWHSVRETETPSRPGALAAGALLGLLVLTKPSWALFVPVAAIQLARLSRPDGRRLARAALLLGAALLVVSPWVVRNSLLFGRPVGLSTMGGSALLQGNNEIVASNREYFGYSVWDTKVPGFKERLAGVEDEAERDRIAGQMAVEWLLEHPDRWPTLVVNKLARYWTPFLRPHARASERWGVLLSYGVVLVAFVPGAAIGFARWRKRPEQRGLLILYGVILSNLATCVVFFSNARYRFPTEPAMMVFAAAAVEAACVAVLSRRAPTESADR